MSEGWTGWDSDKIELLRLLWAAGHSGSVIANMIGCPGQRNIPIGKAHRLKLPPRKVRNRSPVMKFGFARPGRSQNGILVKPPRDPAMAKKPKQAPVVPALPPMPVPDAIVPAEPRVVSNGIALLDLQPGMCRWPIGDPRDDGFHFCGRPRERGKPYCPRCCGKAYAPHPLRRARRDAPVTMGLLEEIA